MSMSVCLFVGSVA